MSICVYLGCRTPKRAKTVACRVCEEQNPEQFKECTRETNIIMLTNVEVDSSGNTLHLLPNAVSDTELFADDFILPPVEKPEGS